MRTASLVNGVSPAQLALKADTSASLWRESAHLDRSHHPLQCLWTSVLAWQAMEVSQTQKW